MDVNACKWFGKCPELLPRHVRDPRNRENDQFGDLWLARPQNQIGNMSNSKATDQSPVVITVINAISEAKMCCLVAFKTWFHIRRTYKVLPDHFRAIYMRLHPFTYSSPDVTFPVPHHMTRSVELCTTILLLSSYP